ncbi:MAG: ubiquinol-cytochrome C chaperone family protein [Alphaproteobacteria bacterium]
MLNQLFARREIAAPAASLYAAIMTQARQAHFFSGLGVADSLDGRFDMLVVHAFLVIRRLKGKGDAGKKMAQQVFDTMFTDLDQALRESGVSDTTVPKKIKAMAAAFYGRAAHYEAALADGDNQALTEALTRNVFPKPQKSCGATMLAAYVRASVEALDNQHDQDLIAGRVRFPLPETFVSPDE